MSFEEQEKSGEEKGEDGISFEIPKPSEVFTKKFIIRIVLLISMMLLFITVGYLLGIENGTRIGHNHGMAIINKYCYKELIVPQDAFLDDLKEEGFSLEELNTALENSTK